MYRITMRLAVTFCLSAELFAQSGIIATLAGGPRGFAGDNGPAARAQFTLADVRNECDPAQYEELSHLSVDRAGNIYLADTNNNRIRRITPDGTITTVAGNGQRPAIEPNSCSPLGGAAAAGDGGPATSARLYGPSHALMLPNGLLLIADQKNNRIRQVTPAGSISTVVGTDRHSFFLPTGSPASLSPLDWPSAIAVDTSGRGYFAELHSNRIARVNSDGRLQLIAGTGLPGLGPDGPDATRSALSAPTHILFDAAGNLLVVEQGNHRIRRISPAGAISTIAGTGVPGFSGDGGPASAARLNLPNAVAVDGTGNIYIADMGNHRVRRVSPTGAITTVAGTGEAGAGPDLVPATQSALHFPSSVAVDSNNDLLILDWQNYRLRKVSFSARPAISPGGVVNAASFVSSALAPGALISIFGTQFAASLTQAASVPLPAELDGVTVSVQGKPLPLVFVSPTQINAQLPYDIAEGPAAVRVTTAAGSSSEEVLQIAPAGPGVFLLPGGARGVIVNQDFTLNGVANPESRGRVLTVYLTGIGPLDGTLTAGEPAPAATLLRAALPASATLGSRPAPLLFLGLSPGFVGLAQANVQIPADAPTGPEVELRLTVGSRSSNPVAVAVQ